MPTPQTFDFKKFFNFNFDSRTVLIQDCVSQKYNDESFLDLPI